MEQIKIDIVPVGVAPVAHASQFDNGRQIRFNLFNQGTPYTLTGAETVTMVVNGEEENITNTSDNYVIWDVAEEDCEEVGVIGCEIRIVLGSMLIGSKNFFLEVEMDPYNGKNLRIVTVGPADICTFDTTLPEPYQSVTVNVEATGGNGTPENPIPINGYTEANITRCGVNLFSDRFSEYRKPVNYYIKNIPLEVGKTYTLTASLKSGGTAVTGCYFGVASKGEQYSEFLPDLYPCVKTDGITTTSTLNVTSAWTSPKLVFYVANETVFDSIIENYDISLTEGTTTPYTAYNGTTVTISFGQTVYGGQLIILPDRTYFHATHEGDYLSTLNWTASTYGYRTADLASVVKAPATDNIKADIISEEYNPVARNNIGSQGDNNIAISTSGNILVSSNSTPTGYAVYELATPLDIDLTPEQIRALVGVNNVFADCGETTVEYLTEE